MKRFQVCLIVVALSVLGCGSGGGGGGDKSPETKPELVRILNAAPNASAIQVTIEKEIVADNLQYGDLVGYQDVLEGAQRLRVRRRQDVLPVIDKEETFAAGTTYTLVITETDTVAETVLAVDLNTEPDDDQFRLRISNFSPYHDSLTVYLTDKWGDITKVSPAVPTLEFKSSSTYLEVDKGVYRVQAVATGTTKVLYDSGELEFEKRKVYSFFFLNQGKNAARLTAYRYEDAAF